jgi:hypothetical protein
MSDQTQLRAGMAIVLGLELGLGLGIRASRHDAFSRGNKMAAVGCGDLPRVSPVGAGRRSRQARSRLIACAPLS